MFWLEISMTVRKQRLKARLDQSFRILLRLLFSRSDKTGIICRHLRTSATRSTSSAPPQYNQYPTAKTLPVAF
jgi:hypothetical protein